MHNDFELNDDDLDYGDEYVDLDDIQQELMYKPGGLGGLQFTAGHPNSKPDKYQIKEDEDDFIQQMEEMPVQNGNLFNSRSQLSNLLKGADGWGGSDEERTLEDQDGQWDAAEEQFFKEMMDNDQKQHSDDDEDYLGYNLGGDDELDGLPMPIQDNDFEDFLKTQNE